jgi:phosphatidylserine decarboxylase
LRLASYGKKEIAVGLAVALFLGAELVIVAWLSQMYLLALAAIPFFAAAGFVCYFFRDPERKPPAGGNLVLSPADGTVTHIEDVDNAPYVGGPAKKVSIFMSLFSVHVNRAPVAGVVEFVEHHDGKYLHAGTPEAIAQNENQLLGISNEKGKFLVKQISGVVARRIVCAAKPGDKLGAGERFGMIKFGSRLEVYVPKSVAWEVRVKVGDKTRAGETVLGAL